MISNNEKKCLVCNKDISNKSKKSIFCSNNCKSKNFYYKNRKKILLEIKNNPKYKEYRLKKKEKIKKYYENYRLNNKSKINKHNKNWKMNNPLKVKCQNLVLIDKKKNPHLYPKICCICSVTENIDFHHPNYDFPYSVYPLCRIHHKQLHNVRDIK